MSKQAISVLCPSATAAAFIVAYLDSEGYGALWARFDEGHTVLTTAPLALVQLACDAADSALRLSAQRGGN